MSSNQPMDTSESSSKSTQSEIAQKTWEINNKIQGIHFLNLEKKTFHSLSIFYNVRMISFIQFFNRKFFHVFVLIFKNLFRLNFFYALVLSFLNNKEIIEF